MSKRIFSLVMTLLLVFSMVVPTMAAPLDDVKDTKYEEAVARLAALGILQGYEDGTFKADKTITRAEFAAVAMRSLGLDYTAKSSNGPTAFKDVDGSHWASGYINLATSRGIIKGFPDGTFKPEKEVTYAESITMLVRLLGYEPSVHGDNWPSNYLVKAAEIGVTGNLDFDQSAPAPRGDVAILTNNSLDIDLMERDTYGTGDEEYVEMEGETLLTEYLNVIELEEAYVVETPGFSKTMLDPDEVYIMDEDEDYYTFEVQEGIDVDSLLGHEVTLFVKDTDNDGKHEDDELVTLIYSTVSDKDIIAWDMALGLGYSDSSATAGSEYKPSDDNVLSVTLDATDDTFDLAEDAIVYFNYERISDDLEPLADVLNEAWDTNNDGVADSVGYLEETYGKYILNDDDEVVFMSLYNYEDPVVITEVDLEDENFKYFTKDESESTLDLDGETYTIYKNGKLADLEALDVDDVVYIWELTDNSYAMEAFDYKISGTLEDVASDGNKYWDYVLVVDGQTIYVGPNFTYSMDENDEITRLGTPLQDVVEENVSDLEDMVGAEVTVYIGKFYEETEGWNYGRHITTAVEDNDSNYFMVSDPAWKALTSDWMYYVELLNGNNDEVVYELTEDNTEFDGDELDLSDPTEAYTQEDAVTNKDVLYRASDDTLLIPQNVIVDVDFNSDGTISTIDVLEEGEEDVIGTHPVQSIDEDLEAIRFDSTWYNVTDQTVFFDATEGEAITWADIEDIELANTTLTVKSAVVDDTDLEAIVFTYAGDPIGTNDYAVVLKRTIKSDGLYVTLGIDGEVNEYYADDLGKTDREALKEGAVVKVDLSATEVDDVLSYESPYAKTVATNPTSMTTKDFGKVTFSVSGSTDNVVKYDVYGNGSLYELYLDPDKNGKDSGDTKVAEFTVATGASTGTFDNQSGTDITASISKFEIVSGGVSTRNGTIEVVFAGYDEDSDPTYFFRVDQTGEDTFIYDIDSSWLSGQKVLELSELADGDFVQFYDFDDDGIYDMVVVYDR